MTTIYTFTSTVGAKTINGRYTMDGANHTLNITFGTAERPAAEKLGLNKGINASVYMNGSNLQILFAADKLLDVIEFLGSITSSLQAATSLLKSYDGMMIGFEFAPQK